MTGKIEVINVTCYGGTARNGREPHDPERIITFIRDGEGWAARVSESKTMLTVDNTVVIPEEPDQRWKASQIRCDRSNVYYLYPMICPACGVDAPVSDDALLASILDEFASAPDGPIAMRHSRFPSIVDVPLPALSTRLGEDTP